MLAVLMVLTSLIPFSMRARWYWVLPYLAWILTWGFVNLVNSNLRFVPAVEWLYIFLIVAFPVAWQKKLNWFWYQSLCVCCVLVAYGISVVEFMPAYREHQELLAQYPAVDLKPRLAYEHAIPSGSSDSTNVAVSAAESPRYDAKSLKELDDTFRQYLDMSTFNIERRKTNRRYAFQSLMRVHEGFVADFISQPGVGQSRIPGVKLLRKSSFIDVWDDVRLDVPSDRIDQPDLHQGFVESPDTALSSKDLEIQTPQRNLRLPVPIPNRGILQSLHFHNIANFVPLNSLGGVNYQLQARGFDAHAFHLSPLKSNWEVSPEGWQLSRLELVSLLKHRPAAVYVSDHLPAMDELQNAATRPVTQFESDAITRLVNGEDLVAEHSGDSELIMVGSIRAITDCRECHRVPVGGLLGAFTYKLKLRSRTNLIVLNREEHSPLVASLAR